MLGRALKFCTIGLVAAVSIAGQIAQAKTWDENYFPNYVVYDQDGNAYKFYDDLIRDKIVVTNFIYTTCTDICGLATARMSQVVEGIGDRMNKEVFVYSITLTPEIDDPATLKKFISAFGEVEGWKLLTGDPAELQEIRWKLGERSRYLGEHRSDMAMGNDKKGYWRRISLMGNLDTVTREILELDPTYASVPEGKAAHLGDQRRHTVSNRPGEALFQKGCSGCHTIGGGDRVGPDLHRVTARREPAWLMRVLQEPDQLRKEGDPIFTELDAAYPNVLMPYLDLSKDDAADVLSYIEYRSSLVAAERGESPVHNAAMTKHDDHAHDGSHGSHAGHGSQESHADHGSHGSHADHRNHDSHADHGDHHSHDSHAKEEARASDEDASRKHAGHDHGQHRHADD